MVNDISISESKVYISIVSSNYNLIYKGEADFYLEDKQKKLHKIPGKDVDKESVALLLGKGKTAEISVDFPDSCQPGDYLLKIRVYNENEECYYTIRQWFEAYTSHQVSSRDKPIPIGPARSSDYKVLSDEDDIFDVVRNMPEFPGGMPGLMEFIRQNIRYPQAARQSRLEGRVIVQVVIDKDGSVIQPRILRSINPVLSADAALCEEALRIVSIMPKWKPGSQHGVNVKVRFTFPIGFESPTD
ncbi:energy transducer TonB [Phocaeicola vulgatus]|nr:energy transducer TonB [Phocaeicola vulgatus]